MAYGTEVVLGFPHSQYAEIRQALGAPIPTTEEEFEEYLEGGAIPTQVEVEMAGVLKKAHTSSLREMGFSLLLNSDKFSVWETPLGERRLSPFRPELFWDPGEQEMPEDSTWGIALSGRYFPTFLDWRSPHGTLWPIRFDSQMNLEVSVARKHIEEAFPIFSKADIVVIERHY